MFKSPTSGFNRKIRAAARDSPDSNYGKKRYDTSTTQAEVSQYSKIGGKLAKNLNSKKLLRHDDDSDASESGYQGVMGRRLSNQRGVKNSYSKYMHDSGLPHVAKKGNTEDLSYRSGSYDSSLKKRKDHLRAHNAQKSEDIMMNKKNKFSAE